MEKEEFKEEMSGNRLAAVNEECARLNARAVSHQLERMQAQLDAYKGELDAVRKRMAQLQDQLQLQSKLAFQAAESGRGPTV